MFKTNINLTIAFEKYIVYENDIREMEDILYESFSFSIQESEKSYFNPQSMFISPDAEMHIKDFVKAKSEKYCHLGFDPADDCEINFIDGSGDDTNL